MKQSGCLSLIKCTIQTTMCMQVRWTTTGQIINHLIVVYCIRLINKPVSEDMWPQLQPKSYVQKQHIPLGALGTWARPDLRCTFSPKNHNTPWDQRGVFFPRPPGSSLDHGDWWWVHGEERRIPLKATTTSKDQGILLTCLLCVCTHVYHTTNCFDDMREPGVKPVYTLFPQFCKARFKLDVAENSCERLKPCESTLNVFSGHLVLLRTVWGCVVIFNSLGFSQTSKIFSTDMMERSSRRDQQHIVLL